MSNGKWVYVDGVKLWQEWDETDRQATAECNAKTKLNQMRPDERLKHVSPGIKVK